MTTFKTQLFYSYSHKDASHREYMQKLLAPLRKKRIIDEEWYDGKLIPGEQFNLKIKEKIEKANIVIFLVSQNFLSSDACKAEWKIAKELENTTGKKLLPVIIKECEWKKFDSMSKHIALPQNGKAVTLWEDKGEAWQSVYEGIEKSIEDIQKTFTLKPEFKKKISSAQFVSAEKDDIQLEDLFVFPHISADVEDKDTVEDMIGKPIKNFEEIVKNKHTIIRGDDLSGKTVFCRKLFLYLFAKNKPVILVDLEATSSQNPKEEIFKRSYMEQFNGDYSVWKKQENKTIILDNLSGEGKWIEHVSFAKEKFENVFVATSEDYFYSHFKDEKRLFGFTKIKINPLKRTHQEQLITKWMELNKRDVIKHEKIEYGKVDQMEKMVDSIIVNDKIIPRYPFFVLSILQRHETSTFSELDMTSYGQCYYALIVVQLMKSGISNDDMDSCFNFLKGLAFSIHKKGDNLSINKENYNKFQRDYENNYLIEKSIIRRLHDGIINKTPEDSYHFSWPYSYYFFLGQYLATDFSNNKILVKKMIEKVHLRDNSLSLMFTIHHARSTEIIEEILLHTICALDNIQPAKLDYEETKMFSKLLKDIPKRIISEKSVKKERELERENRGAHEYDTPNQEDESPNKKVNENYKLLKNMEILSQIVKNKHGSLTQDQLADIVEIMSDAGLRLINLLLDEDKINDVVQSIAKNIAKESKESNKISNSDLIKLLERLVLVVVFSRTLYIIDKCADYMNKKEIREIVENISKRKSTPAYDLIHYFYSLGTADEFEYKHKKLLSDIISKHKADDKTDDKVLFAVLSMKTQMYFNTHKVKESLRQSVFHLLNLQIKPRKWRENTKRIGKK